MRKLLFSGVTALPLVASSAWGGIVYDNMAPTNEFVTRRASQPSSIYFDDANLASSGAVQINQFNIGYENLSNSSTNFDLLVQFYNTVSYGAAYNVPVGTNPIGNLIDFTGLSVAGGADDETGLLSLPGNFPVATSGTVGYEFEFVTPGTTSFSESNVNSALTPIFRSGSPTVGSSSAFFAYDVLNQNNIVGDARSGDVFTFSNPSNVFAQVGAVAAPALTVQSGQKYVFNAGAGPGILVTPIAGITINSGGLATVAPPSTPATRQLLVVTSPGFFIAGTPGNWTGVLDLTKNDLDLPGAVLATVNDQVRQGFAAGNWNGSGGITSSAAGQSANKALGVIQNNQGGSALFTSFDGATVEASDILVKYTYFGDANLDGVVDASDYSRIDNGLLMKGSLTGWYNGDFNYDGVINGSDYTLIDNAFNTQGASLSPLGGPTATSTSEIASGAVPEPTAGFMMLSAGVGALSRRKRRQS